jgi:hypothetical protein
MSKGYDLTLEQFTYLVKVSSRLHRKQIAGLVSLTTHTRKGVVSFKNGDAHEVPLASLHCACQANVEIRRSVYNLYMHYAHFG